MQIEAIEALGLNLGLGIGAGWRKQEQSYSLNRTPGWPRTARALDVVLRREQGASGAAEKTPSCLRARVHPCRKMLSLQYGFSR